MMTSWNTRSMKGDTCHVGGEVLRLSNHLLSIYHEDAVAIRRGVTTV